MGSKTFGNIDFNNGAKVARNYIKNGSAEKNTRLWATYADSAGTSPVDGTGGSPTITWTRTTSSPLRDPASFLFTKDAANRQGEGASYDFTIDSADKCSPSSIRFSYEVASGTYAEGDLTLWVVDTTTGQVIQPSAYKVLNAIGPAKNQAAEFQLNTGTTYRLCLHVASTSALAYTVKFDDISLSPNTYSSGASISEWVAYTPTLTGFGTVTGVSFTQRRVGGNLEIKGSWTNGTVGAPNASISLPSGLSLDTGKISSTQNIGDVTRGNSVASSNKRFELVALTGTSTSLLYITFASTDAVSPFSPTSGSNLASTGEVMSVFGTVPILGWGVSQVLSSETDTRVVLFSGNKTSTQSVTADVTQIAYAVVKDSNGAWNGTEYVVPVPGDYDVSAFARDNAVATTTTLDVYLNTTAFTKISYSPGGANAAPGRVIIPNLIAGDKISFRCNQSLTLAAQGRVSISRISGPAQIAASEKIYLQYTGNAGTAITVNVTNIDFATKVVDSHGAWNGTTFTPPRPGWYDFKGLEYTTATNTTAIEMYVNGTRVLGVDAQGSSATHSFNVGRYLLTTDLVTFRQSGAVTLSNNAFYHWISITSQG